MNNNRRSTGGANNSRRSGVGQGGDINRQASNRPPQNGINGQRPQVRGSGYQNSVNRGNARGGTGGTGGGSGTPFHSPQNRSRVQNGSVRQNPQPQKVRLTPEQLEINRKRRQREKYKQRQQRREAIRVFLARFILFLLVLAVMSGICAAIFFFNLTRQEPSDSSGYSYQIGEEKYTLKYSEAVRNGRVYISFTDVAELCGLAMTGSVDDMKFVIKGDEAETVRFVVGSRVAYVNTVETRLSGDSYYKNDELYVPIDFVGAYFKGLKVTLNEKDHRVTVERELLNELDDNGKLKKGEEPIYGELYFLLASPAPMDGIDEDEAKAFVKTPDMNFVNNLTAYEEYMNPGNTKEYLTLVNVDHLLGATDVPQDLIGVENTRKDGRETQQLRLYAAKALEALFIEMESAGYTDVTVTSGYRSYSYQKVLFDQRCQSYSYLGEEEAYKKAATIVNPPGASEHQSGLCLDMHNISTGADVSFGETEQFEWLRDNCWKFGFILRYPEDKTDITKISYEPWHYRYVGRYHAQKIYEMGMCLEEYCEYLGIK